MKSTSVLLSCVLCLGVLTLGCLGRAEELTIAQLQAKIDEGSRNSAEAWFYAGTDAAFHYIVIQRGTRSSRFRIRTSDLEVVGLAKFSPSSLPTSWSLLRWHVLRSKTGVQLVMPPRGFPVGREEGEGQ